MDWRVPLADVNLGPEELEAVSAVIRSGWLTMGSVTRAFEEEYARSTAALTLWPLPTPPPPCTLPASRSGLAPAMK